MRRFVVIALALAGCWTSYGTKQVDRTNIAVGSGLSGDGAMTAPRCTVELGWPRDDLLDECGSPLQVCQEERCWAYSGRIVNVDQRFALVCFERRPIDDQVRVEEIRPAPELCAKK